MRDLGVTLVLLNLYSIAMEIIMPLIRRPNGSEPMPTRSLRVEDRIWKKAQERAEADGQTVSRVVAQLLAGYAEGKIPSPVTEVRFPPTKTRKINT